MKTLKVLGMVPLVLIAATAFSQGDDRAVPRSGGGGGGSSSGSRHTGSGGGGGSQGGSSASAPSQSGSSASSGASSYQSGSSSRRPRPGTGTGNRDRSGNEYGRYRGYGYSGYPYSSYYYNPYAYWGYPGYGGGLGFGYGYGYGYGYGAYGYGYGDYYGYYPAPYYGGGYATRHREGNVAQLRTLIDPAKARVYVDGYYAGVADDFDGMFQRLNISPGRHDITLKLEGYASHTFSVYAGGDETIKLRWDMVKGTGETRETIGEEYEPRLDQTPPPYREPRESEAPRARPEPDREVDSARNEPPAIQMPQAGRGEILFDILPLDASIYIDGEFHGKASQVTQIQLPFGRHRVEVVRPGYRTEETEINVDAEGRKVVVKLDRR